MKKDCNTCGEYKNISSFSLTGPAKRYYRNKCNQCRNKTNLNRLHRLGLVNKRTPVVVTEEERVIKYKKLLECNRKWRLRNRDKWKLINRAQRHQRRALEKIDKTEWIAKCIELGGKCLSCGSEELTIDHIIPISKGGTNNIKNLQPLCLKCNKIKFTKVIDFINKITYPPFNYI